MNKEELKIVLDNHKLWLNDDEKGIRANLRGSNLRDSDLRYSDLRYSNLRGSNLRYSDLRGSNLSGSDLRGSNLRGSRYSILSIFKSDFLDLTDEMTLELMRHDAEFCGTDKMTDWANGGKCPYSKMDRDFIFSEKKELWVPGAPKLRGLELWKALAKECNIKI